MHNCTSGADNAAAEVLPTVSRRGTALNES